jgi:hypothetical protein
MLARVVDAWTTMPPERRAAAVELVGGIGRFVEELTNERTCPDEAPDLPPARCQRKPGHAGPHQHGRRSW